MKNFRTKSSLLSRYPLNFYMTFRVTIMTALLKKRLKFLILFSLILIQVKSRHKNLKSQLPHFQILYPVIGVIVALVVSLDAAGAD